MRMFHEEIRDGRFSRDTDLGRFLKIHGVKEVKLLDGSPSDGRFVAEARYGMHLAQSDGFYHSPEDAIKQAVLRVRVLAGYSEELAERLEEFYGPRSGLPKKPECLTCLRMEREEAQRSRIGAVVG
ncbi:MAG: hypothetical protein Q7R48_01135 [bacterium]|nr:hypothetical protein [bacterium]